MNTLSRMGKFTFFFFSISEHYVPTKGSAFHGINLASWKIYHISFFFFFFFLWRIYHVSFSSIHRGQVTTLPMFVRRLGAPVSSPLPAEHSSSEQNRWFMSLVVAGRSNPSLLTQDAAGSQGRGSQSCLLCFRHLD